MIEIEKRAYDAMHQAFCLLRYFSKRQLNEKGREYLFSVADTAHNIPDALAGHVYHRETLERDVLALEELLAEPYASLCAKFLEKRAPRAPLLQRLRIAIGL